MKNSDLNFNYNTSCLCISKKQLFPHDFTRCASEHIVVGFMLVSKIYKKSWLLREAFIKPVLLNKSSLTTRVLVKVHTFVESQTYVTEVNLPFFLLNCSVMMKLLTCRTVHTWWNYEKYNKTLLWLLPFRHQICKILLKWSIKLV